MTIGGSYVHSPMVKFLGASKKKIAHFSIFLWFHAKESIGLLELKVIKV